jgi:hypothetical protein
LEYQQRLLARADVQVDYVIRIRSTDLLEQGDANRERMNIIVAIVVFVVLALFWAIVTAIPLFLFGFCLHKGFTYSSDSFRNTRRKRIWLPAATGLVVVVLGLATHIAALELTGSSDQVKISFLFSALLLIVDIPLIIACAVLAFRARAKKPA